MNKDTEQDLKPDSQKQEVFQIYKKGRETLLYIMKDHADIQSKNSREIRDYLRFQLSLTPLILGFLISIGVDEIKGSAALSLASFLLIAHFIWGSIYYFVIINKNSIELFNGYTRVKKKSEDALQIEQDYLMNRNNISYDDVFQSWQNSLKDKEEKEPEKLLINPQMIGQLIVYILAITLIAITLINWSAFAEFMNKII